jgi:O-antigen ligase
MRIEEHPFFGSGYSEANGHAIHNVFLAAWMYAGLPALLLVLAFYFAIVLRWFSFLLNVATKRGWWVLPLAPEWLAPLLLTPVFRVWISGEGGVLKFAEWVALSIFCGCVLANELLRRRMVLTRPAPAGPAHHDWRGSTDPLDPDSDPRLAGLLRRPVAGRGARVAPRPRKPQRRDRI